MLTYKKFQNPSLETQPFITLYCIPQKLSDYTNNFKSHYLLTSLNRHKNEQTTQKISYEHVNTSYPDKSPRTRKQTATTPIYPIYRTC